MNSSESSTPSLGGAGWDLRIGFCFSAATSGDEATEDAGVRFSNLFSCAEPISSISDRFAIAGELCCLDAIMKAVRDQLLQPTKSCTVG